MKYPLGLFIKPPALPVDIYFIRNFHSSHKVECDKMVTFLFCNKCKKISCRVIDSFYECGIIFLIKETGRKDADKEEKA